MNVQITKTVGEYTMEIRVENIPKDVNAVPSIIEELKKALSNDDQPTYTTAEQSIA